MQRHRVDSSVIASIGFDEEKNLLEVEFQSGRLYHYFLVPRAEFEALREAESIGVHFNQRIRPRFRGIDVTEE